ncbi:MAG: leucine-rich repeat protein [Clostridiales bacterium]|nr:leucine-rich repeat protein [Clostridiales bacterium]
MKLKKLISLVLSLVMMASLFAPVSVFAGGATTITIPGISDTAGSTVDVAVQIENNPGILGATLTFEFDEGLILVGAANGDAFSALTMTTPGSFTSPCNFVWDGQELTDTDILDGVILTLQFKIPDDAQSGTKYNITASYDDGSIVNNYLNPIDVNIINGSIEVLDFTYGDLNSDKKINTTDVIMMRRHIAGGYTQMIKEQAADVNLDTKINTTDTILTRRYIAGGYGITLPYLSAGCNHVMEAIPAKEATEEEEGNIAYWYCKACGKYFRDEKGITAITLDETIIPKLPKSEYSIQYMCDMVPIGPDNRPISYAPDTYKPTQTKILPIPKMDTYKFLGWSDKNGRMYGTEIPEGTTGDLVLYANWASDRNKAVPVKKLGDPIICEDSDNGQILFVYEIGKIQNIPLFETQDLLVANGLITSTGIVKQTSITKGNSEEIGKTIANTTTNSATWTLSRDWNESTTVSEEWAEQHGMTVEEAEELCKNSSNTYNMVNSTGGSSSLVNSNNSSYKISANKAHTDSTYNEEQKYAKFNIDGKLSNSTTASVGVSAGIEVPLGVAKGEVGAEASLSNTTAWEIGAGYEQSKFTKDIKTGTNSWSKNIDIANSKSSTATSSKTWNSSQGFSSSASTSASQSVSKAVSELISKKNSKDSTYTTGGSEGESKEYASSHAQEDLYSSSVTYSEAEIEISERKFESTGNTYGAYRLVQVGMAHVFGVVGYDIKNKSYYTYTYSVLDDDEYKEYLDYSYDRTFNDYETSVLPFEIPGFVNDYVNSRIASSKLEINDDGIVTKYLGSSDDEIALIPSYYTKTNTTTCEPEFHKIKGIAPGLFKDNTNIIGVSIGNFVNEIPESAFEGCTALREVICPNVVSIGANAFKGCSSLSEFSLPDEIESIGKSAFDGIPAIKSNAPTKAIANIVANSNVKNITLDISNIEADDFSDVSFDIGEIETFKLLGGYKEYKGLNINSDSQTTIISGITISDCDVVPIEISSPNLTLERVTVHSDGFALILKAYETTLSIEGISNILSESENSMITKNINLVQINEETYSAIETNGNVLVCDTVNNNDVCIADDKIITITEEEYINYLTSRKVTFNANGGVLGKEKDYKMVPYNGLMGELPVVSRDYYTFDGWYKNPQTTDGVVDESRGEEVTSESLMTSSVDITLYAHWVLNDVSAWTPASELPDGAEVVDTKYSYTQTHYTESSSTSLSGWSCYDSYWVQSGSGYFHYANFSGYNMNGRYADFKSDRWYNYETETNKRDTSAGHTGYIYMHWCQGRSLSSGPYDSWIERTPTNANGNNCYTIHSFDTSTNFTSTDRSGNAYKADNVYDYKWACTDSYYWYKIPYYTCWYTDYYKVFKYTKSETKESVEYPTGNNISNIQEWVQYRIK